MSEETSAANVGRALAYLQAIEDRVSEEELARFFAPRRVAGAVSVCVASEVRSAQYGRLGRLGGIAGQWEGVLAIPVAGLKAGSTMRAWFAMFLQFHNGKIIRQANYDCSEPW